LAWSEIPPGLTNQSIRLSTSRNGGLTFETREILTGNMSILAAFPVLTFIGPRLFIGWSDTRSGSGYHAYLAYSDDGGNTFSPPHRINSDLQNGTRQHASTFLFPGQDGVLHVLWSDDMLGANRTDVYFSTTVDGMNFSSRERVSMYSGWNGMAKFVPSSRMVATWKENIGQAGHVVYAGSNDGGATWSEDRVFTYDSSCGQDVDLFGMDASPSGLTYVALAAHQYPDDSSGRFDLFLGLLQDPWDAVSRPRGAVIPSCVKINPGDSKLDPTAFSLHGQQPAVAVDSSGAAYVLYFMVEPIPDVSVYLAKVQFETVGPIGKPIFGLPVELFALTLIFVVGFVLVFLALVIRRRRRGRTREWHRSSRSR